MSFLLFQVLNQILWVFALKDAESLFYQQTPPFVGA